MNGYKLFYSVQPQYNKIILSRKHFWKNMDAIDLQPPITIKGMMSLDKSAFKKTIKVPRLIVCSEISNKILPLLKKKILKMEKIKPVRSLLYKNNNKIMKEIILHPLAVTSWDCLPVKELIKYNINETDFSLTILELTYDNWRADEIFKVIFSENHESLTSFSRIGHIVHINLRDHLLSYKKIIGDILKDKVVGCRTVVNKGSNIDNTYRFFQLELICGEPVYKVEVKENGNIFEFDFSKVYWNPRLSTEHQRITNLLQPSDILYDVFAGVGPFSIPAAKKKCKVLANDLNPDSFKWLNQNILRNKCTNYVQTFNKDGRDFILHDIRNDLIKTWQNKVENQFNNIHITMNLPALAVEFLNAFNGLLDGVIINNNIKMYPLVHVYSFAKGNNTKENLLELVENNIRSKLNENLEGVYFVRNVAPNKDMFRVSFYLTKDILFSSTRKKHSLSNNCNSSSNKKICS